MKTLQIRKWYYSAKTLFLLVFMLACLPLCSFAKTPEDQFKSAGEAYRLNHFNDAAAQYEALVKEGYKSGALYYNLGNTYYRMNKSPEAILYYEKAKLLMPADEDVEHNLKLANLGATDKITSIPELGIITFFHNILSFESSSGWATLAVILLWLALAGAALYLFIHSMVMRKTGFYLGIICFLFAIVSYFFAGQRKEIEDKKFAIVFAPVSYIKTSPEESGKDAFYIHSGTKIEVKDHLGDWLNIRLADGKTGWMKKDEAEEI